MEVNKEYSEMYKTFNSLQLNNKVNFLNDMIDMLFKSNQIEEINYPIKTTIDMVEYKTNLYILKLKELEKVIMHY